MYPLIFLVENTLHASCSFLGRENTPEPKASTGKLHSICCFPIICAVRCFERKAIQVLKIVSYVIYIHG